MPEIEQIETDALTRAQRRAPQRYIDNPDPRPPVQPRLLTIGDACRYAAISRSEFYKTWLRHLRTVHAGKRHLVDRESLDRRIDEMLAQQL
jgi:hypothetical protein